LIEKLYKELKCKIILFGGQNEIERNNQIMALAKAPLIHSGCGNDLFEFPAVINLCKLFITSDTLGLHIALALKRRTIALFGPTSANEIEMYGLGKKIISKSKCYCCYKKDCGAMQWIRVDEIIKEARNLIKEKTVTIEFYKGEHIFGCRDGNKITFMNFGRYVNIMGERGPGFFIVHEFGHIIGGRSNLNNLFPHDSLKRSPTDADCYNAHGILKSYGLIRDPKGESFAEAIALYIYNKKDGIMDFKNECPATHDWIGGNVFVN